MMIDSAYARAPDHVFGRAFRVIQFDEALADLILADQTQLESELPNTGSVEIDSHIRKRRLKHGTNR